MGDEGSTEGDGLARADGDDLARAERLRHTDRDGCLALLDKVSGRISFALHPEATARVHHLRADVHVDHGDYFPALSCLRSARRAWLAAGRDLEATRVMLSHARVLLELGEFNEAVRLVEEVLDSLVSITPDHGEEDLVTEVQATAAHILGDALHGLGNAHEALSRFDVALNLFHALGDTEGLVGTSISRSQSLLVLGMGHRALDEALQAHHAALEAGLELPGERALIVLAEALHILGQVNRSIALLEALKPRLEQLGLRPDLARLNLVLATCCVNAGRAQDGYPIARAAAEEFIALGMFERSGRSMLVAAWASLLLGRLDRAEEELRTAEHTFWDCQASSQLAYVKLTQAEIAERRGQTARALRLAQQVIDPDAPPAPSTVAMRARLLVAALADDEQADQALDEALASASLLGRRSWRLQALLLRGVRHRRAGRVHEAAAHLRRAERIALAMEADNPDLQFRVSVCSPDLRVQDELIGALLDARTHQSRIEAWQWVSMGKSRVLSGVVDPATGRWFPPGRGEADGRLHLETSDALDHLLDGLGQRPRRTTRHREPPQLPSPPNHPVVEYHVLDRDVIAFVIREEQVYVRVLTGASGPSQDLLTAWQHECARQAARDPDQPRPDDDTWRGILRQFHRLLVDPLHDLVEDLEEPLTVVGHRHLYAVPFGALIDDDGRYLGDRFRLRHAFALHDPGPGPGGPPSTPGDLEAGPEDRPRERRPLVLAIPDAGSPLIEAEAKVIASAFPGTDLRLGPDAVTEALFGRPDDCDLVHVACHGVFDRENPLNSALQLADRWLTARELVNTHLDDVDVVLSACSSGLAAATGGEPIGLAWACLAAGARSVVASMWPVEDAVTQQFMELFYEALGAGHDTDAAMARAGSELARTHPHPFHWAAFRHFRATRLH